MYTTTGSSLPAGNAADRVMSLSMVDCISSSPRLSRKSPMLGRKSPTLGRKSPGMTRRPLVTNRQSPSLGRRGSNDGGNSLMSSSMYNLPLARTQSTPYQLSSPPSGQLPTATMQSLPPSYRSVTVHPSACRTAMTNAHTASQPPPLPAKMTINKPGHGSRPPQHHLWDHSQAQRCSTESTQPQHLVRSISLPAHHKSSHANDHYSKHRLRSSSDNASTAYITAVDSRHSHTAAAVKSTPQRATADREALAARIHLPKSHSSGQLELSQTSHREPPYNRRTGQHYRFSSADVNRQHLSSPLISSHHADWSVMPEFTVEQSISAADSDGNTAKTGSSKPELYPEHRYTCSWLLWSLM